MHYNSVFFKNKIFIIQINLCAC